MNLPTPYQDYIALSKYARWLDEAKRRESFDESVRRYFAHFEKQFPFLKKDKEWKDIEKEYLNLGAVGSMRALMTAGPALERDNVAGYNCAYVAADYQRVFDEAMYVLMCGTGVGFSCESKYVDRLPTITEDFHDSDTTIVVPDSKSGWSKSLRELISLLYQGQVPKWDVSKVRPAGSRLKTFGGRASGPEPLVDLFKFVTNTFRRFAGQKLPPIAVHDLMCKVAEIVVVGGVRRSALISLSDLNDPLMRTAKSPFTVSEYTLLGYTEPDKKGETKRKYSVIVNDEPYGERSLIVELGDWESEQLQKDHQLHWNHVHPERSLANNSIAYDEKPSTTVLIDEWNALIRSYSGERGIFNREAAISLLTERRKESDYKDYGCNPCSEIVLRSKQFCNLSEVVVRAEDTLTDLKRKARFAAILGTAQATQTKFRYLGPAWRRNTEDEALLGISLTGIMDHPVLSGEQKGDQGVPSAKQLLPKWLEELKDVAVKTNEKWAKKFGINPAAAVTCVKPSGTVSQLVDSASGIHPRHAPYYIRTVRADKKDPLAQLMVDKGFPHEDAIGKEDTTWIFSFPIKAPEGSIYRDDRSAIQQLELWKTYQMHWCEHKPSITVYVKDTEWTEVLAWVDQNFDILSGVSFLPFDGGTYVQAPYQDILGEFDDDGTLISTAEDIYNCCVSLMPVGVDWSELSEYEDTDNTTGSQEYACTGGACEIV